MEIKKVNSYEIDGEKFSSHEEAKRYVITEEIKKIVISILDEGQIGYNQDMVNAVVGRWDDITKQVDARRKELFPRNRKGKES